MRDEAVDDSLAALKIICDWFVTSKTINNFYTALYPVYSLLFLMKILVMLHFIVMKWVSIV